VIATDFSALRGSPFVAISIDLCGSTHVKQRIVELAQGDRAARQRMYGDYKRLLYDIERSFYLLMLQAPEIDFERLTLVKSLGDELWYAYRLDAGGSPDEIQGVRRLLGALLHLISSDRALTLASDIETQPNATAHFELPIKVYADLVTDWEELNCERYEHLKEAVAAACGRTTTVIDIDATYLEACERLNLGVPDHCDGHHQMPTREDFIGLDIDRFFRLTEQCYPRLLTIGQSLFDLIGCKLAPAAHDYDHLDLKLLELETSTDDLAPDSEPVFAIRRSVASSEMKGISDDYAVFHLFDLPSLGSHFAAPSPVVEAMMDQTRGYLAEKGFFAVVSRARASTF
jgi:hypothetical protein